MDREIYIIDNVCPECGAELPNPFEDEVLDNKSVLIDAKCECDKKGNR
jgi:hypothetical protein